MTDIVERLRLASHIMPEIREAADEIERLRADIKLYQSAIHQLQATVDSMVLQLRQSDKSEA